MSILGRLFGKGTTDRAKNDVALAMVMLPDVQPISGRTVLDHLATHATGLPTITAVTSEGPVTVAQIPGGTLSVTHVPIPIPQTDLAGPVALAWHWPNAAEIAATHRSHMIVHVGSRELDALTIRLLHTKLVAATLAVAGGLGVLVGNALLVRSAADYATDAAAATRSELPILAWVGFNGVAEEGSASAYTTGLSAFGLLELEVRRARQPHLALFGMLADLAHYQLSSGRTLKDGDTFGASEADRTRVRYGTSEFIPNAKVAVVELE